MRASGVDRPEDLIVAAARYAEEEGARCADALLNDRLAICALQALQARGLSCPGDVSVTGFNDAPFLDLIPPGLTTVRVLQFDLGRTAAEVLGRMMESPETEIPSTTILPVNIIERSSVGPARRPGRATASGTRPGQARPVGASPLGSPRLRERITGRREMAGTCPPNAWA